MALPKITTVAALQTYLHAAMQLEHATIPPYLTALYSMRPATNSDVSHLIRVVVVEEMLHLTLAANVLNAVGGAPDLTRPDFVPSYPAYLPDGETDFEVDLQPFSKQAIDTFLKIERPARAPDEDHRLMQRGRAAASLLAASPDQPGMQFYSIGEFYAEIDRGLVYLHESEVKGGEKLFVGDAARQVTPDYYYSGGGEMIPVTEIESARAALQLIAEQGEGLGGGIYDAEDELAHYYRYQQILIGRYYQQGDHPDDPTGPPLEIDWDAVYPVKTNARLADYPDGSELHAAALQFNRLYADFLGFITRAYNGSPELLLDAVAQMFRLRDRAYRLIRNPIPGVPGCHAAPTFETALVAGQVQS
ncbi:MAG: ferritin-like domain-containing protein [Solirubrobacteraceae bacterium]